MTVVFALKLLLDAFPESILAIKILGKGYRLGMGQSIIMRKTDKVWKQVEM